jgi:plasmid maintenance system antidote protein VapI
LASNYLKALQLTKHLEKKAQEATHNRKLADSEIVAAEELIEKAKHMDANVAKAEAKLTEATSALAQKEFKNALELAQESKSIAQNTLNDHVNVVIDSTRNLVKLAQNIGIEVPNQEENLTNADNFVKEEKYEEALDLAKKGWEVVDKLLNERVSKDFTRAQSLIVLAKKIGQDVKEMEDLLDKARDHTEKSDYESALKFINECLKNAGKLSSDEISKLIDTASSNIDLAKRMDGDVAKAEELHGKAKTSLEENDFETAKELADRSIVETEKILVKGGAAQIRQCDDLLREAKAINAEITKATLLHNKAKEAQKNSKFAEVYEYTSQIREEVENAQFQAVLKTISLSRPKFITAKNIGADLAGAMKYLDMSRKALKEKKFAEAMEYARKGENTINGVIGNYEGAKQELQLITKALARAAKIGVDTEGIKDMMKDAKKAFDRKDYKDAMTLISKCRETLEPAMFDRTKEIVDTTANFVAIGEKTGSNVDTAKEYLEQARVALKSNDYEKAIDISESSRREAGEGLKHGITQELKEYAEIVSSIEDINDKKHCVELLTASKSALSSANYNEAYNKVMECKNYIDGIIKSSIDLAESGIKMLKEMKGHTEDYEKMLLEDKALYEEKKITEALSVSKKLTTDIINQQSNITTEMLVGISENLKKAQEMGIDISQQTQMIAKAKEAISNKSFTEAYSIMTQSNEEALSFIEKHSELSATLGSMKSRVDEAKQKGIDITSSIAKLKVAENALSGGSFEAASKALEEINSELEQQSAVYSVKEKLTLSKECIAIAKSLDLNTSDVELGHKKSVVYMNNGQLENAITSATKTAESAEELCNLKISEMLSNAYSMIIEAKKIGLDVLTVEVLYQKAEEALALRKYEKAAKYASQSLDEIEEIRDESQRSANIIHLAGNYIQEAENIKADVTEAKKLLERAFTELKNNEYMVSIELGKKCIRSAKLAKEKKVSDAIQMFENNLTKLKKEGGDVEEAEKLLEEAKLALNDEDYKEALRLAMLSENEIEKADLQKKMAVEIISVTAAKLKDAEKKGIGVDDVRAQLMEAANALKNNDYILALENAMESGMGLTEATEEYERALSTLHAAQARVNESDNIGVTAEKATELLTTAKEAFDKKDYTTAIKYAKETIRDAKRSYEDHLVKPIKNCEELIATAENLGVDVTRANNMLSEAKAALDEEAFSQVALFSQKCKRLIEREITKILFEKLSTAKSSVNEAKGKGVNVEEAMVLLKIGETSLENKDYVEAASNFHKFAEALEFAETGKRPEPKKKVEKKPVEVVREVVEEPVEEEVVEPEIDLGEFYKDLEMRIHKISKIGISTKHAEKLMKKGMKLLSSDIAKAKEMGLEADAELESSIESRSPNIITELDTSIIDATEKIFDITLNLKNEGKSVAKDVNFQVQGKDFEVQGLSPLKILKANEKLEIPLKIKALHGGALKLLINITFLRIFDQKQIETLISQEISIKEKEKRVIEGPFQKYKAEETVKCYACNGKIKPGFMLIHCSCGNTYHDACGGRLGKCPMCGTEFKKKSSAKKKLALRVG